MCVCVCVRDRETDREGEREGERGRERGRERGGCTCRVKDSCFMSVKRALLHLHTLEHPITCNCMKDVDCAIDYNLLSLHFIFCSIHMSEEKQAGRWGQRAEMCLLSTNSVGLMFVLKSFSIECWCHVHTTHLVTVVFPVILFVSVTSMQERVRILGILTISVWNVSPPSPRSSYFQYTIFTWSIYVNVEDLRRQSTSQINC